MSALLCTIPGRRLCTVGALCLVLTLSARAALDALPIPETHSTLSWLQKQRVRFYTATPLQKAHDAIGQKRYSEAVPFLKQVLEQDPGNNRARVMLINIYNSTDRYKEARTLIDTMLEWYPTYCDLYLMRANGYMKEAQFEHAARDLERFVSLAPNDHPQRATARLSQAEAFERQGRLGDAQAVYVALLDSSFDAYTALRLHELLQKQAQQEAANGRPERARVLQRQALPLLERVVATAATEPAMRRQAQYALAKHYRADGDTTRYSECMEAVIQHDPNLVFVQDYTSYLYETRQYAKAQALLEQTFRTAGPGEDRYRICVMLGDLMVRTEQPESAIVWLERALDSGQPALEWILARARADHARGAYDKAIERLLPVADHDQARMAIAYAFMRRSPPMPGLALHYLDAVEAPEALAPDARFSYESNRAYLLFDHCAFEATLNAVDQALICQSDDELFLVRLRTLMRLKRFRNALEQGQAWLAAAAETERISGEPPSEVSNAIRELLGIANYSMAAWDDAVTCFDRALARNPNLVESRYLRAMALIRLNRPEDAQEDLARLEQHADSLPPTLYGDLALVLADRKQFKEGLAWLARSLAITPCDIDSLQEQGYQAMKAFRNPQARASFAEAIGLYNAVIPYVDEPEAPPAYAKDRTRLKDEYTKLDRTWSGQLYGQRTDMDFPGGKQTIASSTTSTRGALQSQGGLSVGYRPPKIGFRNEKTLDAFLRVLTNFERNSWQSDADSLQGGVGLAYKPLVRHNAIVSVERLFKIGDNAEDNWLWRNTYGLEGGERAKKQNPIRAVWRLYTEASYYMEPPRRRVFFGQGNIGPGWSPTPRFTVIFPDLVALGRYQDTNPNGIGTYSYGGIGFQARLLEGERALTRDRWAINAQAHYVWGRFDDPRAGFDRDDFEGWIIGVNITR